MHISLKYTEEYSTKYAVLLTTVTCVLDTAVLKNKEMRERVDSFLTTFISPVLDGFGADTLTLDLL